MKRLTILAGLLIVSAILVAAGWYFVSPLFLNRTVDEDSPFTLPATQTIAEEVATRLVASQQPAGVAVSTAIVTAVVHGQQTQPANVTAAPATIRQGRFVDGDSFHKGSGVATLYAAPDGAYLLRFERFTTTNGPDLHVLLSPNAAPADHAGLGDYLDLGALKGNVGDQNYTLPAGVDPALYKSVVIYCLPFRVIFATATLK